MSTQSGLWTVLIYWDEATVYVKELPPELHSASTLLRKPGDPGISQRIVELIFRILSSETNQVVGDRIVMNH